jgi:hypothetical protein
MRATALTIPAAVLMTAGALAAGLLGTGQGLSDPGGLVARVDKLVQIWQPTEEERRLDEVGWAPDLCQALDLAKENGRPVFLFTYSGSAIRENAICLQRC